MKKLLLLLLPFLSFGQTVSFVDSDTIMPGTTNSIKFQIPDCYKSVYNSTIILSYDATNAGPGRQRFDTLMINEGVIHEKISASEWVRRDDNIAKLVYFPSPSRIEYNTRYTLCVYLDYIQSSGCRPAGSCVSNFHVFFKSPLGLDEEYLNETQKDVFYYNIQGIEIKNPNNYEGVLIKKTVYSNGKIITTKVLQ